MITTQKPVADDKTAVALAPQWRDCVSGPRTRNPLFGDLDVAFRADVTANNS